MVEQPERSAVAGLVVIVTGASSGIGEAVAREFGRQGARVVLAARRGERLQAVAEAIRGEGGVALPVPTDVTVGEQIASLVKTTLEAFGRIDVLASIAGWGRYDWFERFSPEVLRQQYAVNVIGLAETIRQVLPVMQAQRSGTLINMSSYASRIVLPPLTVYSSTKYAVEGLTDGLRRELAPWGIRVIRVHPSAVTGTEFNEQARAGGGISYTPFPFGKVSRERVAREVVRLVARPRRALFLSRLYDVGVAVNKLWPGALDWISSLWVRRMRRKALASPGPEAPSSARLLPLGLGGLLLLALLVGRLLRRQR